MHGTRDQLLSGAGLTINKDRGTGRRHDLDLLEDVTQDAGVPDDVVELHLGADFIFQVDFLSRELLLEFFNLFIGQRVVESDRDLLRNLDEQLLILFGERLVLNPRCSKDAQRPVSAEERTRAPKCETFACLHRQCRTL